MDSIYLVLLVVARSGPRVVAASLGSGTSSALDFRVDVERNAGGALAGLLVSPKSTLNTSAFLAAAHDT